MREGVRCASPSGRGRRAIVRRVRGRGVCCRGGRIAQRLERLSYTQEVAGSIPASPTRGEMRDEQQPRQSHHGPGDLVARGKVPSSPLRCAASSPRTVSDCALQGAEFVPVPTRALSQPQRQALPAGVCEQAQGRGPVGQRGSRPERGVRQADRAGEGGISTWRWSIAWPG